MNLMFVGFVVFALLVLTGITIYFIYKKTKKKYLKICAVSAVVSLVLVCGYVLFIPSNINVSASNWFLVERGDTWNKYRNGSKPEYRIELYGDLVNYKNETGVFNEINISHLASSVDGSYSLSDTPYKFVLDSSKRFFTVYPDRNNRTRYIEMYMPSSFTMNGRPFWQNAPSLTSNTGSIRWSSPGYDVQLRCGNSKLYFELILKNALTAVSSFNMTVIPHNMSIWDVGWLNILTDSNDATKPVIMTYNQITHDMRLSFNTIGLTYPITVDPSLNFYTTTSDGYIYWLNEANYNDAWSPASGETKSDTDSFFNVGQVVSGGLYSEYRSYLYFDTSSLVDTCIVTNVTLYLKTGSIVGMTDWLVVQNGQPTYPNDPMVLGDYDKSLYSGNGGSKNMNGVGTLTPVYLYFNSTGFSWINPTGTTKFALRSSNDIAGIAPSGSERTQFYANEGATGDPQLTVTYYDNAPIFYGERPSNNSANAEMPTCNVTINHGLGYNFNYTLSENTTGTWVVQASGNNVLNGSYSFSYTNASVIGNTYYWMVSAVNGTTWHNETYNFIAYNLNTSVNLISPYVQTSSPLGVTASGYSGLDNVTLFYRSSSNNATWNRSYENYTTGQDDYATLGFPASTDLEYQTFTIGNSSENNTFLLRYINLLLMKYGPMVTSFTVRIYSTNSTGAPNASGVLLATSDAYPGSGMSVESFEWCSIVFSTPIYLQRGITYGMTFSAIVAKTSQVYVGYDTSSATYPGGCRYTYTVDTHVTTQYGDDDFLFDVYGDWIQWNSTSNPDVLSPWAWSFDMVNNSYYEFFSQGKYSGQVETLANGADARCRYVYVPGGVTVPVVTTNASTGIQTTNATLWGFLSSNGSAAATCGFWYDVDSGAPYANNQSVGITSNGATFSYNASSLISGQLYYFKAWANNSAGFNGTANELTFTTSSISAALNTTIRTNDADYFVWLGLNTSAYFVKLNITGLNEASEYVAVFNDSGQWEYFYGDKTGINFSINTFDVVKTFMDDAVGNITFDMENNSFINYSLNRTVFLKKVGDGYNYTGWTNSTNTSLTSLNNSLGLTTGYAVSLWNETTFSWNHWISCFGLIDKPVLQYDVVMTKIDVNKTLGM